MHSTTTNNLRIKNFRPLIAPNLLLDEQPITEAAQQTVIQHRQDIAKIMHGDDDRLVVIVGPCSIHDPQGALEYARLLQPVAEKFRKQLCIIMRVYFEKPRTTIGWKGLINDPHLDDSFDINHGLRIARRLLLDINNLGLATGSEFLDTIIPQFITDLTSWSAIGARTTESQIHRELASGLSMPVGFKNTTAGDIQVAIDAVSASVQPHHFLGITKEGIAAIISTTGNENCHVILRGSNRGPNYDAVNVKHTVDKLIEQQLLSRIMIDCSHGNSNKDHLRQLEVVDDIIEQMLANNHTIFGVMLESNIIAGKQKLVKGHPLVYGQSITDACIDWEYTQKTLELLNETILTIRKRK